MPDSLSISDSSTFTYLGHQLVCSAHSRAGNFEATLLVRRFTPEGAWERILSHRCGIKPTREEAIACAREYGEEWVVKHG